MQRRVFSREFKLDVKEVARQLDVHYNSLFRWVQEYDQYGECLQRA
jgi:transposase-like protein